MILAKIKKNERGCLYGRKTYKIFDKIKGVINVDLVMNRNSKKK